jgi:hypothetical protein
LSRCGKTWPQARRLLARSSVRSPASAHSGSPRAPARRRRCFTSPPPARRWAVA